VVVDPPAEYSGGIFDADADGHGECDRCGVSFGVDVRDLGGGSVCLAFA